MQITHSTRGGCQAVALTGQITVATAPQIQWTLLKDLAGGPLALICDLGGVDALDPVCATTFAAVANHPSSRWPATNLLLCNARPAVAEILRGLGVRHVLPLYDTLQEAVDAAVDRPGYLHDELHLAPTPTAAAAARRFVRGTLQAWGLSRPDRELSEPALLLAGELVTNAAVHAQTAMRLRLGLSGEFLHIAVRDLDRRLPRVLPGDPQGEGGRGLRLVEQVATAWGAQHHPGGGKVVWCTLRISWDGSLRPATVESAFPVHESKLIPPLPRPGVASQPNPLGRLMVASGAPVLLPAPPGYGKATLRAGGGENAGGLLARLWFHDQELLQRHPGVAVVGAWLQALGGDAAAAERWADAAERGAGRKAGTSPDDTAAIGSWLALLNAAMCRHGVEQLRSEAELACRLVATGSRLRAAAVLLLGIAHLLAGDLDSADRLLAEAIEVAEDAGATDSAVIALAEQALVGIDRGEWDKAELLVDHARSLLGQAQLDDKATNVLLYAVAARVAVHQGEVPRAHADLAHAQRLRPQLTIALPIHAVQARLVLAHTYVALSDVAGARTILREVDELLRRRPHLGVLGQQADQLRAQVDTMRADVLGASSLTGAELRVLPLLASQLTFRELSQRLHLSFHSVKSQALSIYRKLGVSSRSQAIQHAKELGLLPP
jgi:DNA-binding CsgD family transcriptional regulator/anti-anti-sigma regulatory factor